MSLGEQDAKRIGRCSCLSTAVDYPFALQPSSISAQAFFMISSGDKETWGERSKTHLVLVLTDLDTS